MSLVTLAELEQYIGDIDDNLGNAIVARASAIVSAYCDRTFESTTYTDQELSGYGTNSINLPQYPVITFTSLSRRSSSLNESDWELLDPSNYFVNSDSGVITYASSNWNFYDKIYKYKATYTAGYATIPDDLKEATLRVAVDIYNNRRSSGNVQSESIGDYSITYNVNANSFKSLGLDLLLDKYKKPTI